MRTKKPTTAGYKRPPKKHRWKKGQSVTRNRSAGVNSAPKCSVTILESLTKPNVMEPWFVQMREWQEREEKLPHERVYPDIAKVWAWQTIDPGTTRAPAPPQPSFRPSSWCP